MRLAAAGLCTRESPGTEESLTLDESLYDDPDPDATASGSPVSGGGAQSRASAAASGVAAGPAASPPALSPPRAASRDPTAAL